HIGGTATRRAEASTVESRHAGTVHFHNLKTVKRKDGSLIVMNRNGEVAIADENGRERERYAVVYGAKLNVRDGQRIAAGEQPARYNLPVGANITVNDGDQVDAGEVIARIPRETTKTKDITGGLPRVAELFEARKPKEHAVISEIEGVVSFGKDTKGKRKVVVTPDIDGKLRTDMATEYLIGKGKHINVHAGDRVKAGDPLMDGAANPHDILKVLGEKELARYMVDEVQEVYRLQ